MEKSAAICCFDGTSRTPGAGQGAQQLWDAHFNGRTALRPHRFDLESKNSAMFCRQVHAAATDREFRLALGGEHLISFPLVEALKARHPDLRLVVIDAHHDAYDYPLLTHYSLFHYTVHDLGIPTLVVGARYELEQVSAGCRVLSADVLAREGADAALRSIETFLGDDPFYLSLDLDVLEPAIFPAVSAPVDGGLTIEELRCLVAGLLARDPVAADITEYNPMRAAIGGQELDAIEPIAMEFRRWL